MEFLKSVPLEQPSWFDYHADVLNPSTVCVVEPLGQMVLQVRLDLLIVLLALGSQENNREYFRKPILGTKQYFQIASVSWWNIMGLNTNNMNIFSLPQHSVIPQFENFQSIWQSPQVIQTIEMHPGCFPIDLTPPLTGPKLCPDLSGSSRYNVKKSGLQGQQLLYTTTLYTMHFRLECLW